MHQHENSGETLPAHILFFLTCLLTVKSKGFREEQHNVDSEKRQEREVRERRKCPSSSVKKANLCTKCPSFVRQKGQFVGRCALAFGCCNMMLITSLLGSVERYETRIHHPKTCSSGSIFICRHFSSHDGVHSTQSDRLPPSCVGQ